MTISVKDEDLIKLHETAQEDQFSFNFSNTMAADTITLGSGINDIISMSQINNITGYDTLTAGISATTGPWSGGTFTYPNHTYTTNTQPIGVVSDGINSSLHVRGEANFDSDVKIKGKSLLETIERLEQRLAILSPNPELESEWEDLKRLGDEYRKLEAHIKDKMKVWEKLKDLPKIDLDQ